MKEQGGDPRVRKEGREVEEGGRRNEEERGSIYPFSIVSSSSEQAPPSLFVT